MQPVSVLLIGNFFAAPGARAVGEDLAERLEGRGHSVWSCSGRTNRVARLSDMLWTAWQHRHDYRVAQVDVYSGPSFLWAEAVCRLFRQVRKPYVLTLRGGALPAFAARHARRVRRLLASAAAVTAPSPYLARELARFRPDIRILQNPLDLRRYPYRRRGPAPPDLVWLRSFEKLYNPDLAVRVVKILSDTVSGVRLTMIGRDKGDGSLDHARRLAADLGVAARIAFIPGVAKEDVPACLDRGAMFLNTADVDNTPVSVLEAMACGLCVVSTGAGGIPDLLRHNVDALIGRCGDADGLAALVRSVLDNTALAQSLSAEARRSAEAVDWSRILPRWEELLESAALNP